MKVTITVTADDVKGSTNPKLGVIERALYRALLEMGISDVDMVHDGLEEIGFCVDGVGWECQFKNNPSLKDEFDSLVYGQAATPRTFTLEFERTTAGR